MAYYFIFPEKDSTIYSHPDRDTLNTGNDEILELVKEKGVNNQFYYPSRILIQFKNSDIKQALSLSNNITSSLQLFSTEHKNLATNQSVEVFPLSQSWDEGTGKFSNLPISSDGCSWLYRDNLTVKTKWITSSFAPATTGSISRYVSITKGGGEWYTGSEFKGTQTFSNADLLDLDIDVTSIVQKFSASLYNSQTYPTGIPNYGFIVKNTDNVEENISGSNGQLQYFSSDTHTIYPPKLAFKWDDSTIDITTVNGEIFRSTAILPNEELNVSLYNSKKEYNINEVATFRLHIREKYPTRQFITSSNYLEPGYFKTTSYYSIRDAHTEEIIIPFDDNCTKLSADSDGMFFKLYMNGLQPERYYRILLKSTNDFGTTIFDDNYHFKVVR